MLIRTPDVWTRQPQNVLLGVNADSAFSRSLVMAFSAASKDLGQTRWSLGAGAVQPFKAGLMIGGDGGFSIQPSIPALISNSFSILALVRRVDTANSQTVISQRLAGHGLEIGTSYIDLVQWNVQNNVASGETLSGDIVVAVTRNGNAITYYANGRQYGTATASSTINSGNGELASIGSRAGSGAYYGTTASTFGNGVYCCFVWSRPLSSAEISDLSVNPWQIFAPERRTLFVPSGAGGTLNAAASGADTASGSASLSAQVALASVGVANAAGTGNLTASIPLSATGFSVSGGSANDVATVTISASGLAQAAGQSGVSASVLLAGAGAAQAAGNATLAAMLDAMATGAAQADGSANLTGGAPGSIAATGGDVASGSAVLSVTVGLQAAGGDVAGGTANAQANSTGSISATGGAQSAGSATWSATVKLTAAGFVQAMGAGQWSATVSLSAFASASASGSAMLAEVGAVLLVPTRGFSINGQRRIYRVSS